MPPSEIKKEARESLKGKWGKAVLITLTYLGLSFLIGWIQEFLKEGTIPYYILEIIYIVINVPLSFGLIISFIKLKRNEDVRAFDFLKEGFTRLGKSWGIIWHTFIRLLLPIVCFILIVVLHTVLIWVNSTIRLNPIFSLVYIVLLLSTVIYVACRTLLYVLAYNICYDNPDLTSKECVKKSEELMKGHRGNYFMLGLSFIGWFLLLIVALLVGTFVFSFIFTLILGAGGLYLASLTSSLIMIIGMLLLMPYMQVTYISFYERIINNVETIKK